jgi:membrane fusion protein (multidrug efflux system)
MADPILKFPPEQKGNPAARPRTRLAAEPRRRLMAGMRRYRRVLLLVVVPVVALMAGLTFYLNGGRYVTTDDAYVGAQKVLITPDISGKIINVAVREGQQVSTGDVMFQIDPVPFKLALAQARAKLDDAKTSHDNLVANVKLYAQTIEIVNAGIALKQRDVDRKSSLVKSNVGSQLDMDNSGTALVTAQAQLQLVRMQNSTALNQLLGNPELPLEEFPAYMQAKAVLDDAQRNLDLTTVRAPMNGIATQVDQIQLGRFVMAGSPVFSVIDTANPWVDANPKESDFTYVAVGQPVTIDVDAFPDHVFKGTVGSLSPGTGAQFAILPPQNATGNFVKVVQRVPVRIYFDSNDRFVRKLKAGMSAYTSIDTGHRRSLAALLGFSSAVAAKED